MSAPELTPAQVRMLRTVRVISGADLAEVYRRQADGTNAPYAFAWRCADRTASALLRLGLIMMDGDAVHITVAGVMALGAEAGR